MKVNYFKNISLYMGVLSSGVFGLEYQRRQSIMRSRKDNSLSQNIKPSVAATHRFFDGSNSFEVAMPVGKPSCHCNETIPSEFRLPKLHNGKDYTIYDTKMDKVYGKDPEAFEELFKQHVAEYNNLSGSIIHFPSGTKHVYRSAMLAYSPETLKELMKERAVTTVFHLSNKKTVNQKAWTNKEKEHFFSLGGKPENYIHILDFDYIFNDEDELIGGQKKVAEIIQQIEKSEGNVLIHCLGGEHKTELIFEVMQKCYNHVPMENIIARYKCHTAWSTDPATKSGYKQNNVDFIQEYPSELLDRVMTKP
jgi:hypothetical protein